MQIGAAALIAAGTLIIALMAALVSTWRLLAGPINYGYTTLEQFAANPWDACVVSFGVLLAIPPIVLLTNVSMPYRAISILVHNRVCAGFLLFMSALALLSIPFVHIVANASIYDEFSTTFNVARLPLSQLGDSSLQYLSLMQSGPLTEGLVPPAAGRAVRGAVDVGLKHPKNSKDLSGGWITGPGNAKVTMPMSIAVTDLALAMVLFRTVCPCRWDFCFYEALFYLTTACFAASCRIAEIRLHRMHAGTRVDPCPFSEAVSAPRTSLHFICRSLVLWASQKPSLHSCAMEQTI
jgi:hypothetical protein